MRDIEARDFVRGLTEDLQVAQELGKLAFHLREMILRHSSLARLSDDFIWLALRAARDDAVIHLWKVVDTSSSAKSLPWFIRHHSNATKEVKSNDLERLSPKSDDINRLRHLRNEVFAHRTTAGTEATDAVLVEHNLSEAEFLLLIRDAFGILRIHSGGHLTKEIFHDANDAIDQLIDLDVYLLDAIRGDWGIERLELENDGTFKLPRALRDPRADY